MSVDAPAAPDTIRIVVAGAVEPYRERTSINRQAGKVWSYRPQNVQRYQAHLRLACDDAMDGRCPLVGPVLLRLTVYLPIPVSFSKRKHEEAERGLVRPAKRPDLSQFLKAAEDALNRRVIGDDAQIVDQVVRKFYSRKPRLVMEVAPAAPEPLLLGAVPHEHHHHIQSALL